MNKEEIERIALEEAANVMGLEGDEAFIEATPEEIISICARFLHRIDAERGKEAVAWRFVDDEDGGHVSFQKSPPTKEQIEYLARWNRPKWEPLFLSAPTIPEGMALVPIEPTDEMISAGCDVDDSFRIDVMQHWDAMIASAQGKRK